jgi:peptide/nickel transport system substrate-binding protein
MPTKVNRRDFLRTVALGTAGAIIAGCVPPVPAPVTVKETVIVEKPVEKVVEKTVVVEKVVGGLPVPRDQTVVLNESAIFRVFDAANPFAPNAMLTSGWDQLIAARLMYLNWATGESVNMLLVDNKPYEYNSDFTQITFHARKEAKWNDGVAFTAKDIKFTVEMLMGQPKLGWSSTFNQWVDSVTCPDDYTAVFKLKAPNPRFHQYFKQAWSCPIVAEHEWKGKDPVTYKAFPPIGTGAFKFKMAVPEARMLVFEKVDNWWGKARGWDPAPQYVVWQTSPPPEAEIQDLADNYIDHAHSYTSDAKLLRRSQELNKAVVLAPWRDPCPRGIWFNCGKYPLSKPEVRWAMFHCVDKQKAADKLYPWPTVPATYPWADWGGNAAFERPDVLKKYDVTFDPAKGAKILDDLGFKPGADGIRVDDKGNKMEYTIIVPQQAVTGEYPIALDFAENLGKIGIKAAVKWQDFPVFDEAIQTGNFDITSHWWCGNWAEPPAYYSDWQAEKILPIGERAVKGNWIRLNDPELDKVTKQIDVTSPDDPKIKDLYTQAVDGYFRDMPSVPVIQTTFVMPFNTKYWKGWPDEKKIATVPFTWWPEFQFTLYNLKKA